MSLSWYLMNSLLVTSLFLSLVAGATGADTLPHPQTKAVTKAAPLGGSSTSRQVTTGRLAQSIQGSSAAASQNRLEKNDRPAGQAASPGSLSAPQAGTLAPGSAAPTIPGTVAPAGAASTGIPTGGPLGPGGVFSPIPAAPAGTGAAGAGATPSGAAGTAPADASATDAGQAAADSGSSPDSSSPQSSSSATQPDSSKPDATGVIRFESKGQRPAPLEGGISIFEALDEALVKSPRAAALRSNLQITKSELARATEQPSVQWFFDRAPAAEQVRRVGSFWTWEPPWKLVFRLIVAKRMVDQAKLDLMAQLWNLRAEVRTAYTEVVVAQETLETLNSLYDLAHRLRIVSEKRFQAGDVPELDLLKARLAESQYDVDRKVGFRRVIRAKQQLNVILGRLTEAIIAVPRLPAFLKTTDMKDAENVKNPLLPDFSSEVPALSYYVDLAMGHRYELKSLNKQIDVNKANMTRALGDIVPNSQFWMGSSTAGNPPTGPKLSAFYFGFGIPTNITEFQQGDIAKYKATGRQLKYQVGATKNVITGEVSSAYNNVLAARQNLKIYEEHVLADSYEVARLARRSYEVGQSDITSTIQAQQQNVQIRTQYLNAITLYQQAFTQLEQACGTPLLQD